MRARYIVTIVVKYASLPVNFFIITTSEPKVLALRYISSSVPYQKFLEGPFKSLFKSFFLGTKLGQALQVMSTSKAVPEGLKSQECKKRNRKKLPPIPYVPVVDEVHEAVVNGEGIFLQN
jgi:hypothetical protein